MSAMETTTFARPDWARLIIGAWQSSVEGILHCGRLLTEAKAALRHGEFSTMVREDLPFGDRTARYLMAIASHEALSNRKYTSVLPPNWGTLAELAKLPADEVTALIDAGELTPETQQRDIRRRAKKTRRVERERELGAKLIAMPEQLFGVIYADPPWRFEPYSRESGMDRAADNHYPTMTLDDIKVLKVPTARNAVLFQWATVPMLVEALDLMKAWGFTYRSHFVWVKDRAGTGYWNRNRHELLLIGTRGDIPAPAPGEQFDSVITAPVTEHSAKPFRLREIIEEMFPTLPRIELFAREQWAGWGVWGNEVKEDEYAS